MPKQPKQPPREKFKFLTERTIRAEHFELTRWQSADLRRKLPKGTYWVQPTGRVILWNFALLQSFLLVGADDPSHRALLEEFVAQIPQSA